MGVGHLHFYCIRKIIYCIEMYTYCIYSTHIFRTAICLIMAQSCTIQDEVVNPLTPRKYTALNGNFLLHLCNVFQECNPGVWVLPVLCQSSWQHSLPWHTQELLSWHSCHAKFKWMCHALFMVTGDIQNQLAHKWCSFVVVKWTVFERHCSAMSFLTF